MDYEYYYNNARSRYSNACSEINCFERGINELEAQKRKKINLINQLKIDIKNHTKAFNEISQIIRNTDLNEKFSMITKTTNKASANYSIMISSQNTVNKNLNDVFADETKKTKGILNSIQQNLSTKKKTLEDRVEELKEELRRAESQLQDIESKIRINRSNIQEWRGIKTNASIDMEYYRRKMNEAVY